ncbi:MAG: 2-oxo acid dehydrogenase subunit E2 [Pseudomonadales bacterium]
MSVKPGDKVVIDQSLIVLESAKATMEVPSSAAGTVLALTVKVGDKVASGAVIAEIETEANVASEKSEPPVQKAEKIETPVAVKQPPVAVTQPPVAENKPVEKQSSVEKSSAKNDAEIYAGPAVRQLARELGVELCDVQASGPRGRMTQDDVRRYVKHLVGKMATAGAAVQSSGIPPIPAVDFSKFGAIELLSMTRIDKITRDNMHRSWVNLPHVTQWDEADVTDLEEFPCRYESGHGPSTNQTHPVAFLLKAAANALREYPKFNRSLHEDGEHFVQKSYVHIGIAVDTPMGLMVPVIRDAPDKKACGIWGRKWRNCRKKRATAN